MKKNFIKIFLLIFLISNLIFSENKKLNENYGIEDGEVYYINRKIVLNRYQKLVLDWEKIKIVSIILVKK